MANDGTVKIGVEFDENDFNKEAKKLGKESKHAEKEVSGLERGIQDFSKSASDGESAASGFSGKLSTHFPLKDLLNPRMRRQRLDKSPVIWPTH